MTNPTVALMLDNETLGLGPKPVILQVGIIAYDLTDPSVEGRRIETVLPAQPQIALGRTVSFDTILWWLDQDKRSADRLRESSGNDMEELLALVRSIHNKMSDVILLAGGKDNVELWAKGPQFDVVGLETLFEDCGLSAPWAYNRVMDLRTLMNLADVHTKDVDSTGITPHVAIDDCRFQMRAYAASIKALHSSK